MKHTFSSKLMYTCLLFITILWHSEYAFSQHNHCTFTPGPDAIGPIDQYISQYPEQNLAPVNIKIFIHVIRRSDKTGGQSIEAVKKALKILQEDYAPFNIAFVWDCNIDYIDSDFYYKTTEHIDILGVNKFPNGINIYLYGDQDPGIPGTGYAAANTLPGDAFFIYGNYWKPPYTSLTSDSHVISHEMGHCLGLYHTDQIFFTCYSYANNVNCSSCGDFVCDTPVDPGMWYNVSPETCEWLGSGVDIEGTPYNPDETNIMAYTEFSCITGFSPGQGYRMQRIIQISPLLQSCLVAPNYFNQVITQNTVWSVNNTPGNGDIYLAGDLIVRQGATLTIEQGVRVHFNKDTKLVIEPGGLVVLSGTLSGFSCTGGAYWEGVKVWGNLPSVSQYPVNGQLQQGRIECRPNSTIENARVGIQLYGPTPYFSGGQLQGREATIKNCVIGVEYAPYNNFWPYSTPVGQQGQPRPYFGSMTGMSFTVDDLYPHQENFKHFIGLTGINGVTFAGCNFINALPTEGLSIKDWGYGIYAHDSYFTVKGSNIPNVYPPQVKNSRFEGLGYGIYSARIIDNKPYMVTNAEFDKCFTGIRNQSVTGAIIKFNSFRLENLPNHVFNASQIGIYFNDDVLGFECSENSFFSSSLIDEKETVGVVCKNTGWENKKVRNNNFTNLHYGNIANGVNGVNNPFTGMTGLTYECNNNSGNNIDIDIPDGEVRARQGMTILNVGIKAAGNTFSYRIMDIINFGKPIDYHYTDNIANHPPLNYIGNISLKESEEGNCTIVSCPPVCDDNDFSEDYNSQLSQSMKNIEHLLKNTDKSNTILRSLLKEQLDSLAFKLLINLMTDTLDYNRDSIINCLEVFNSPNAYRLMAEQYFMDNHDIKVQECFTKSVATFSPDSIQVMKTEQHNSLLDLLKNQNPYFLNLDSVPYLKQGINALQDLPQVKNILTFDNGHFNPEFVTSEILDSRSREDRTAKKNEGANVKVYPNPSSGNVTFETLHDISMTSIKVYSSIGTLIHAIQGMNLSKYYWNTESVPSGVYYYIIESMV